MGATTPGWPGSGLLELSVADHIDKVVVLAVGEVDVLSSGNLRRQVAELVAAGRDLVLDLRGVTFMDASGIGVLLGAHRMARACGLRFALQSPSPALRRVLEISGVSRVLPFEP
jgi:anti-anti-sigma factor